MLARLLAAMNVPSGLGADGNDATISSLSCSQAGTAAAFAVAVTTTGQQRHSATPSRRYHTNSFRFGSLRFDRLDTATEG
jgi:hypothetical protein